MKPPETIFDKGFKGSELSVIFTVYIGQYEAHHNNLYLCYRLLAVQGGRMVMYPVGSFYSSVCYHCL